MKKLLYLFLLIGLSSCEFYYLEPVYSERDRLVGRYDVEEYSETYNDYTHYSIWIDKSSQYSNQFYIDIMLVLFQFKHQVHYINTWFNWKYINNVILIYRRRISSMISKCCYPFSALSVTPCIKSRFN